MRSLTAGRREGSKPKRLPYKVEPVEYERLAKKITKKSFRHRDNINEADRQVPNWMPKHLFSGKMSNGKKDRR